MKTTTLLTAITVATVSPNSFFVVVPKDGKFVLGLITDEPHEVTDVTGSATHVGKKATELNTALNV